MLDSSAGIVQPHVKEPSLVLYVIVIVLVASFSFTLPAALKVAVNVPLEEVMFEYFPAVTASLKSAISGTDPLIE